LSPNHEKGKGGGIPPHSGVLIREGLIKLLYMTNITIENFNELSLEEKRVAVAKDVINQLNNKVISTDYFGYLNLNNYGELFKAGKSNEQVNNILPDIKCDVCALGGMFISLIKYTNHCTVNELSEVGQDEIDKRLKEYFSEGQLCLIETAYEQFTDNYNYRDGAVVVYEGVYQDFKLEKLGITEDDLDRAAQFNYDNYYHKDISLINIMKNIIENNGTFKP
jgi:hypothetical protein